MKSEQDGFGSMFENFGRGGSQVDLTQVRHGNGDAGMVPAPLSISPGRLEDPPSPWTADDPLLAGSSPMQRTFSYESDSPLSVVTRGVQKSQTMPLGDSTGTSSRTRQQRPPSDGLRRSSGYGLKGTVDRSSGHMQDEDARLVMDSINASKKLDKYSSGGYSDRDSPNTASPYGAAASSNPGSYQQRSPRPLQNTQSSQHQGGHPSANTTPRPQSALMATQEDQSLFDAPPGTLGSHVIPVRPRIQAPQKPQTQNKIMTPAEFEKYRREQELKSTADPRSKEESSDEEDDYDDDDEAERAKQAVKQRRKQEAHMSVYRQQMMKVTGEQPSDLPQFRPTSDRATMSTPNLRTAASIPEINFDKPSENGNGSDEDDDDVPLGVLAAHGFPSKNRPPNTAGNNVQFKSETYPPPPASTTGASQSGRASGLPPFARKLPADPYYGASLVNSSDRQAGSYGHRGSGSTHGVTPPGLHPAGLVGVINAEEHARAARRGSPNAQGNYGSPLPPGMAQFGAPPGMPPAMSAGDQAMMQMAQQMRDMMQMQQMQMQMFMQNQGQMPPGMMPPGMMPTGQFPPSPQFQQGMPMSPMVPQVPGNLPRPSSTGSHPAAGFARPGPPRAMSMTGLAPNQTWQHGANNQSVSHSMMSGGLGGPGPGYTASIAPSERSNVGQPSRYRPISIAPTDEQAGLRSGSRTSTFTEGMLQPGAANLHSRLSSSGDRSQSRLSSLRPVSTTPPIRKLPVEEDDEEGWEEMKKKRDQKKGKWRLGRKKEESSAPFETYDYPDE